MSYNYIGTPSILGANRLLSNIIQRVSDPSLNKASADSEINGIVNKAHRGTTSHGISSNG